MRRAPLDLNVQVSRGMLLSTLIILGTFQLPLVSSGDTEDNGIEKNTLHNWASQFGGPLFELGKSVTKYNEMERRFQNCKECKVEEIQLEPMLKDMTEEMNKLFNETINAIKKIVDNAEEKAQEFYEEDDESFNPYEVFYKNAKKLNADGSDDPEELYYMIDLKHDHHFGTEVNTNFSVVHVPSSIYERKLDVTKAVKWSESLDSTFRTNYKQSPTLNWQYFASSSGFLRLYPAMKWPNDNTDPQNPDMFDARIRPWYVNAANHPKNILILHDTSGSMTGLRKQIAQHVVYTILDTLTENDFVNAYHFSDDTTPVVPCFKDKLVQANLENVREIKDALDATETAGIANYTSALNIAFDVLYQHYGDRDTSSTCNQAIMIITDGAPYRFEEIFAQRMRPDEYVRIFTYLIGRDVTETRNVQWMACNHRGYYAHVATLSEVQEQVLTYLPVMSRPLVMYQHHDINFSPVYRAFGDVVQTDWIWAQRNALKQRRRSERYKFLLWKLGIRRAYEHNNSAIEREYGGYLDDGNMTTQQLVEAFLDFDEVPLPIEAEAHKQKPDFQFMITASMPVFDPRNSTVRREIPDSTLWPCLTADQVKVLGEEKVWNLKNLVKTKAIIRVNSTYSYEDVIEKRIANFLGVAASDIMVDDLKRIMSPFRLGVNGYAFMITNNGYVVFHPDWRPIFNNELLKPNYNAVDLTEVELIDSDDEHIQRNNHSGVVDLRRDMIQSESGWDQQRVKVHQDQFRRVTIRDHRYEYKKLKGTPFTLAIVAPNKYFRYKGEFEIRRDGRSHNLIEYFENNGEKRNWKINPEWTYCKNIRGGEDFMNPEDLFLYFLQKMQPNQRRGRRRSWQWRNTGLGIRKRHSGKEKSLDAWAYSCEKELVQSLVFDANVTYEFSAKKLWKFNKNESDILPLYGALFAFIATRSGLTKWIHFENDAENQRAAEKFVSEHPRATEELWYQRAVDRYYEDKGYEAFIYSVPFDAGTRNDSKVTATRAIFVTNTTGHKAPVAVVGVQFDHHVWAERFFQITSTCIDSTGRGTSCKQTCESGEFDCFVLDENAFILISERHEHTGKFFGEVDGIVLEMLINSSVYKKISMFDYQGVCTDTIPKSNFANILLTPFNQFKLIFNWCLAKIAWLVLHMNLHSIINPDLSSVLARFALEDDEMLMDEPIPFLHIASINKTRLRPCDQKVDLYTYGEQYKPNQSFNIRGVISHCGYSGCDGFFNVQHIPHTNLILLVIDAKCGCGHNKSSIIPSEVEYDLNHDIDFDQSELSEEGQEILSQVCQIPYKVYSRRKMPDESKCISYHSEEELIEHCGGAGQLSYSIISGVLTLICVVRWYLVIF